MLYANRFCSHTWLKTTNADFRRNRFRGEMYPLDCLPMIDAIPSYRCKVTAGNSRATLNLGRRKYAVNVTELSRDSFCVRVPHKIARKVIVGRKLRLFYQDMLWSVECTQKWLSESNHVDLEFKQLAELTPIAVSKKNYLTTSKQVRTLSDNSLPIAIAGCFIVTVLILPAWGGQWGTSDAICNAVSATWNAFGQLITGRR